MYYQRRVLYYLVKLNGATRTWTWDQRVMREGIFSFAQHQPIAMSIIIK